METNMSTTTSTFGYNRDSSSSSPTPPPPPSLPPPPPQLHTLIFNNHPQNSHNNLHPPPSQTPITDPDLTTPQQQQQQQQETATKTCYRECLRNHAASMGSHVVDGCGEFMPSGEEGTPQSFICAACDCHRNFHRKHIQQQPFQQTQNLHLHVPNFPTPSSSSQRFSQQGQQVVVPPLMMNFGSGPAESSSEDLNVSNAQFSIQTQREQQQRALKKRIRTKFSQEQKDKMMEFGEKIGWKISKHDEHEVQQFCSQVGIKRKVFKVWMHNNKQAMKKHQQQQEQM